METKLTLKLDKNIIEDAKRYAKLNNISLSRMVERYFKSLFGKRIKKKKYSPLVEELSGIIKLDSEYNVKEDYTDYLIEKYR